MTYTRPDISYATKELARALQQPITADQQKPKHFLRYIRPTVKLPAEAIPDGPTVNYGSRTQATIAFSGLCTTAELYAINTGATEALHIRSLLMGLLNIN